MTQHALAIQEGGTHYKNMAMQPIEFAYVNRYDPAAFSILKYVSRHRAKNGVEDLKKGRHFVQLRRDLIRDNPSLVLALAQDNVSVSVYIEANNIHNRDAAILVDLHAWATGAIHIDDTTVADFLIQKFDALIATVYPHHKD